MTYAIDTNTLIFLLNKDEQVVKKRDEAILAGCRFVIPPIVDYEIQRGLGLHTSMLNCAKKDSQLVTMIYLLRRFVF